MTDPILPTKLFIPQPRLNLVPRPRLLNCLDAALGGKLTLVSAPAGYGKTTLLAEWVQQVKIPVKWLSLDPGDNDPPRFWRYFVAALQSIELLEPLKIGESLLRLLKSSPLPEHEQLLGGLIAEIAAVPERYTLILDDFHLVTNVQILDGLFYILENLPPGSFGLHLILSCRSDPPWPLARLRVQNQITELRASDLRFTPEEATVFLKEVMQLSLLPEHIVELEKRTEGWVAGLQMAALSMQGRNDIPGFLEGFSGSHRFVLDFLVEEVLNLQTPEMLDFLLKTSILERMTGSLCAAVSGDQASAEILLWLEKANMFLIALDDQRIWYRYHQLFADLLQKQLLSRNPEQLPELHRRASSWYAQSGLPSESVAHALKTQDWNFAAIRIEEYVLDMIQIGEITLVRHWMSSLPDEIIRSRPILCIAQAWTSTRYASVELAEELISQAEAALSKSLSQDGSITAQDYHFVSTQIAVLQVVIARARGDSTQHQQELALEALQRVVPAEDAAARATLFLRLGFCYLDLGKDEQADRIFSQSFRLGNSSGNHYAAHSASYGRMVIARRHGKLHKLAGLCRQTLDTIQEHDDQHQSLSGIALTMLGSLYYEWNDLDEAERLLTQGLKLVEQVGIAELLVKGHFALACIRITQGDEVPLPNLEKIAEGGNPELASLALALQVRLILLQSSSNPFSLGLDKAVGWARSQQHGLRGQPTYDWEIYEKLVYARVLCRQFQSRASVKNEEKLLEVLVFLQEQCQSLEKLDWEGILVEVYLVMAVITQILGRKDKALIALEQALILAEPGNFVRTFLDEGDTAQKLIQDALSEGICEVYTQELVSIFNPSLSERHELKVQQVNWVEEFSERERQVLRLLNTELNVPEIAAEIHLAPTTVRTHVQNIYRKLDVHGRIAALQKAEELGLL